MLTEKCQHCRLDILPFKLFFFLRIWLLKSQIQHFPIDIKLIEFGIWNLLCFGLCKKFDHTYCWGYTLCRLIWKIKFMRGKPSILENQFFYNESFLFLVSWIPEKHTCTWKLNSWSELNKNLVEYQKKDIKLFLRSTILKKEIVFVKNYLVLDRR